MLNNSLQRQIFIIRQYLQNLYYFQSLWSMDTILVNIMSSWENLALKKTNERMVTEWHYWPWGEGWHSVSGRVAASQAPIEVLVQTSQAHCSADGQESGLVEVQRLCQPHSPGQVRLPEIIISLLVTKAKTLTLSLLLTLIYTPFTFLDKAVIYLRTRVLARFCSWGPCYSSAMWSWVHLLNLRGLLLQTLL